MEYRQSIFFAQEEIFGKLGLSHNIYKSYKEKFINITQLLSRELENKKVAPFKPMFEESTHAVYRDIIHKYQKFKTVFIVGTGGSTLGAQSLYDLLAIKQKNYPKLVFLDNIDSKTIRAVLSQYRLEETGVFVVSKSGKTIETISIMLVLIEAYRKKMGAESHQKYFAILTAFNNNPLHRYANNHNLTCIPHSEDIGGRFSIFSNVALLPAAFCGVDIESFCAGGRELIKNFTSISTIEDNHPLYGAFFLISCLEQKKISNHVMMPYIDRLKGFVRWYKQLCAESLGKNGSGITPIDAFGTIDQHSQLQLYLEGPSDKVFTVIVNGNHHSEIHIENQGFEYFDFLEGKSLNEIMTLQQQSTIQSLVKKGRPVRVLSLSHLDEKMLGMLSAHFILEVLISAKILNINPN